MVKQIICDSTKASVMDGKKIIISPEDSNAQPINLKAYLTSENRNGQRQSKKLIKNLSQNSSRNQSPEQIKPK